MLLYSLILLGLVLKRDHKEQHIVGAYREYGQHGGMTKLNPWLVTAQEYGLV